MTPVSGTPTRQAALLAHGLLPEDRDWLLGRLEPHQRSQLGELLRELHLLRIPTDHDWLQQILRDHQPATVLGPLERLEQLDEAGVSSLAAVLRPEPPELVDRFLSARAWPWRSKLAEALGRDEAMDRSAPEDAPALAAAVLDAVASAMAAHGAAAGAVHAGGRWTQVFRWRGAR